MRELEKKIIEKVKKAASSNSGISFARLRKQMVTICTPEVI